MQLREQLEKTLGDAYTIERELGGGGMARVFLAQERALGRRVVVKVLSPELAAAVSTERFAREIRLAATLQQANIVPLLNAGSTDGLPYYTMPFVEGQSLRQRLANGALPTSFVINILRDVARALAYAHERGIVHRDIKPDNVLLSGDAAVVTDFGIAKAISASQTAEGHHTLTSAGVMVGTPAYMAPEQAFADPDADHRADLYSFGCMAYELLTGEQPFRGTTLKQLVTAHAQFEPRLLTELRADVPPSLASLVMRCLSKDPVQRPQSAREILAALDTVVSGANDATAAWMPSLPRRRRARVWTLAAAAIAVAAIALAVLWPRFGFASSRPRSLAVMPFTNIGGDSTQEYFSDGMAVDLTDALSKVPGLRVTARSLAFTFKGRAVDARAVGRQLDVDALLEGTVQRFNGRLRVTAQLTRTRDGVALWSNSYDRDSRDVFGVQDAIARSITDELRLTLAGRAGESAPSVAGTSNFDAYNSYLRGVFLLERRGPGVFQAITLLRDAIAKDSTFARAYGKLSEALELLPYFSITTAQSIEHEAMTAAQMALRLDSTVATAHIGLGLAYDHALRWDDGEREFIMAVRADPTSATAHVQYGRHLMHRARIPEAMAEYRRAVAADPLNGTALVWIGHMYSLMGKYDSAIAAGRRARAVDPGLVLARSLGAKDALDAGNFALARSLASSVVEGTPPWRGHVAYTLAMTGDTVEARATMRDLEKLPASTWMVHTALAYASLGFGDTARALTELERAAQVKELTAKWDGFADRVFDSLRHAPRFYAVIQAFHLDADVLTSANGGRPVP